MIIGIPKEIKNQERRVALTPEGAASLKAAGHELRIEQGAGLGSGFADADYFAAGAYIATSAAEAWDAELVVKVKEPLPEEYDFLRPNLCLFTYLHLAAVPRLVPVLLERKVRAIGYETVQLENGSLPLLTPMSRVAGRVAAQMGATLLQSENGTPFPGKGVLMGGVEGVPPARVLILGGGNVGLNAAEVALGMGAEVCILDANVARVSVLRKRFESTGEPCDVRFFSPQLMFEALEGCDLLIGAALIPGEHAPLLLTTSYLERMRGGVFVDVAIDQGGISETSRPTSYAEPVYVEADVLHCCLPNLPACVPLSATRALTHATLPYVQMLADQGIEAAMQDAALARGVNTWNGLITHAGVAHALKQPCTRLDEAISRR